MVIIEPNVRPHEDCSRMAGRPALSTFVVVPAASRARYVAPVYARMLFVYGPSTDGHASSDTEYMELDTL